MTNVQVQHLHAAPARDHSQEKVRVKLPGKFSKSTKGWKYCNFFFLRWAVLVERRGERSTTSLPAEEALHRLIMIYDNDDDYDDDDDDDDDEDDLLTGKSRQVLILPIISCDATPL